MYIATIKEYLRIDGIAYYQAGYDSDINGFRHRLNFTVAFNVKLTGKLNLRTSFDCQYENRPVIPITKFIYSLSNGLTYSF